MATSPLPVILHAGASIDRELTVANRGRMPRFLLRAEEKSDIPGYRNAALLKVGGESTQAWRSAMQLPVRGRFNVGSIDVTAQDPFGLFGRTIRLGTPSQITVFPKVLDLPLFRTSFSSLMDFGQGGSSRRISQISPSASSVREMASGDSQEHIHWRSTAHVGKLMVKVFDSERSSDNSKNVWILLDMERGSHQGSGAESTEEYAVTVAASLAKKYLDDGMRVGMVSSAEKDYRIAPGDSSTHFTKLLEALTFVSAKGTTPVDKLVQQIEQPGDASSIVLITPSSSESVMNGLRLLRAYSHPVAAVLVDSSSFGGADDPSYLAQSLAAIGAQVYVVRKGDNISRALDSRGAIWNSRYA